MDTTHLPPDLLDLVCYYLAPLNPFALSHKDTPLAYLTTSTVACPKHSFYEIFSIDIFYTMSYDDKVKHRKEHHMSEPLREAEISEAYWEEYLQWCRAESESLGYTVTATLSDFKIWLQDQDYDYED